MVIIFNDAGLSDVQPPCVAQSFINHNARLFKIFVVGSHSYVIRRPSIKNLYAGGRYFEFCVAVLKLGDSVLTS